ncbi:MAG: LamG-like jellyroll fold domain-containing protein, partial [Planctomycetota bacterium]
MFKKLMCLLFCVFVFGVSGAHGAEYDRAAYWDSRYPSAWAGAADAGPAAMRDFFSAAGYTILDADQLKSWMDGHIADGELSVVVMCLDIVPDTVGETMSATCTIRQYLDAGGKVLFYSDWPFYYVGFSDGSRTTWGAAGATNVLGFNAADGSNDTYETVTITADGAKWGLTEAWPGSRRTVSAATAAAENLTVLATITAGGSAAGWVKHYVEGDNFRGFVRYFDTDVVAGTRSPNFGDIQRLAEYIDQKAGSPDPPDGSSVPAEVWETNVYMMLDFAPGFEATTHTVYFSDVEQEVIGRLASRSLGSVPPWPTGFVVGYDDPGIPEYARTPLVYGKTYYWCVDAFDGTDTHPGEVWSFTVMPKVAWDPYPEDGDTLIPSDVTATWKLGDQDTEGKLLSYDVYLGTDETAVADANVVNNPSVAEFIGNVSTETIDFAGLAYETEYFWRVDTKLSITRPPFIPTYTKGEVWSFTTGPEGTGGLLVEYWWNIPGPLVSDLTSDVNYPANPDSNEIVTIFETPTDQDEHFGGRVRGWVYVKTAGDYEFWIATDDWGELWLSSDQGAANTSLIASVDGWVPSRDFDNNQGGGGPNMASGPISLSAGMHYVYVEAFYKEHEGGDNLAVAWSGPDSDGVREVIPGDQLISYYPVVADNPDPPHLALGVPVNVTLTWAGGKDKATKAPYPVQRVYVGTSAAAVAAATTSSPEYKGQVSTDQYSLSGLGHLEQVYWRIDGVTGAGEVPYPGYVWTFRTTYDPSQLVDTNLKLWLEFEDNALDSSGYGNHGTEIGGPTYTAGYYDRAIQLDAIDDYVSVDYEVGVSGLAPRTITGWAKADSTSISNWTNVFGFTGPSGAGGHFDIQIVGGTNSTTQGWFGLHMYGDEYDILPNDMEWHHFAASFDGTTAYFYGDTVLIGSAAPVDSGGNPIALNTPDNVHVGKRDDNGNYFPGIVDDVRIYDKVLTLKELKIAAGLLAASAPDPANGATGVPRTPTLGWAPGAFAAAV